MVERRVQTQQPSFATQVGVYAVPLRVPYMYPSTENGIQHSSLILVLYIPAVRYLMWFLPWLGRLDGYKIRTRTGHQLRQTTGTAAVLTLAVDSSRKPRNAERKRADEGPG